MMSFTTLVLLLTTACSGWALPSGFTDTLVAGGFRSPTAFDFGPSDGEFYVAEKRGTVSWVGGAGAKRELRTFSVSSDGERGLLGLAAAPEGMYVYLTTSAPARNRVLKLDLPGLGNERVLFETQNLGPTNHNAGGLRLWGSNILAAVGDNGDRGSAQNPSSPLGKLLRIPRSGSTWQVHALGLRNPFRIDVKRDSTEGVIADVGEGSYEEVNVLRTEPGANYGWPSAEGYSSDPRFVSPLYAYGHQNGRCSILGIALYYGNGTVSFGGEYEGGIFFSDYCSSELFFRSRTGAVRTFATGVKAVDMRAGKDGMLYYLSYDRGELRRIRFGSPAVAEGPKFEERPADVALRPGQKTAQFRCRAADSILRWFRRGRRIAAGRTLVTLRNLSLERDNGTVIECRATRNGQTLSAFALITFKAAALPPGALISAPKNGSRFEPKTFLALEGYSPLPSAILRWEVWLHHDDHRHPWRAAAAVANSTRLVRTPGNETEPSRSVFLRVVLIAQDPSSGLKSIAVSRVYPPPLPIPAVVAAPLAQFKLGPSSWTDGAVRVLNGTGAAVGDEFNASLTRTVLVSSPKAFGTFAVLVDGAPQGSLNGSAPLEVRLVAGTHTILLTGAGNISTVEVK